jgi:hypothetical protein
MATEIKSTLEELKGLGQELYTLNKKIKELRSRKKELEGKVVEYLEAHNKPGLKLDNIVFITSEKTTRSRKKKDEITTDSVDVLKKHGVVGDHNVILQELDNARKGSISVSNTLKMKAAGLFA